MTRRILVASSVILLAVLLHAQEPKSLKLLFLGDNGPHKPAERFRQLQPVMAARGIDLTYTDTADVLNPKVLEGYDGLVVYANIDTMTPEQEKALLNFVASGKGFIPLHCASYCFRNSDKYVELVGAQFQKHGTATVRTTIAAPDHPVLKGFKGFESFDETYVHTRHNEKDRTVLEYRADGKGKEREPWTWVRTHGKGRVFYTAWGHDERTWGNPGFHNLVERGIRWACGADPAEVPAFADRPEMTPLRKDVKPFQYIDADVPFYPPGGKGAKPENRLKKMQLPVAAEESMKHYVHPSNLELKLFADETLLGGKPICMNWDERGRLWVAVSHDYPNELQPEGKGRDRILIVEDANGDGKADKVTVFADKLSIPTSLAFAHDGVIVHQAPHTLFLRDQDGDGKADERVVLFTGWGAGDTHSGPSNLRYGLDNWYYGIVGYSGFNGIIAGEKMSFRQGFYRFKVEKDSGAVKVTKFEFLRGTNNNSWGVGFSEEGLLFGSTANGCASVYLPIPNRYYERVRGWSSSVLQNIAVSNRIYPITDRVRQVDWHNGFTAAAGHALYTARTYPREYWNRTAFITEPTGHLAATFILEPHGTDFSARHGWNLMAADDEWAAPIMAEVGPDGCVWVIDWYAFIVQHNPTPPGFKTGKGNAYETELRDKKHGRIYRLTPKNSKLPAPLDLKKMKGDDLVPVLKNDNMFWRLHAQRLLVEGKGKPFDASALFRMVKDPAIDALGLNAGAIHALWAIQGMGLISGPGFATVAELHYPGFEHKSAGVRRNAAQVMALLPVRYDSHIYSPLLTDPDPQVRLAALLGMTEIGSPSEKAGKPLVDALLRSENLADRWLPDALIAAAAAHDLVFLKEVATRKNLPSRAGVVVSTVAEHYARGGPARTVASLFPALSSAEPAAAEAIIAGLARGWPKGQTAELNPDSEQALARLLVRLSPGAKGQLIRLATVWGSKGFEKQAGETLKLLADLVADPKQPDEARAAAARQLVEFRPEDDAITEKLLSTVTPQTAPELAAGIIDALGASRSAGVGAALLKQFEGWPPSARAASLRVLLSRPESTKALLDALEKGQVPLGELALDQRQGLASHPDKQLAARARKLLERGGGLPSADRQKILDEFLALTKQTGDADAGKAMFKKHCATCHIHGSEGNKVGPDLTGTAVHTREHLLTDILDPSRNVEGNYRVYTVATRDGRTMNGLMASETKTAIEVIDAQAKKHVVLRENIEQLVASTKSLMPDGFEKQMTSDEIANLLEFLTRRGKYLPIPLEKAATIVSTKGMFYKEESTVERMIFPDWKPKMFEEVPFYLIDPQGDRVPNVILLNGPNGTQAPKMPKAVTLPCNAPARAIHFLSGVSGWGFPLGQKGSVSMIVRLHYEDGKTEDHPLKNGEHFADYIRRVDVPDSKFAFPLRGQQIRYLAIQPQRPDTISKIELVKGTDVSAPIVMAVTVEVR